MLKHQLIHPKISEVLARAGHHSVILIADGKRALVGGANIAEDYFRPTDSPPWHDLSLLIGVNNLFDEGAPSQSAGQFRIGTAALNGYDLRGRRAFFNITKRW